MNYAVSIIIYSRPKCRLLTELYYIYIIVGFVVKSRFVNPVINLATLWCLIKWLTRNQSQARIWQSWVIYNWNSATFVDLSMRKPDSGKGLRVQKKRGKTKIYETSKRRLKRRDFLLTDKEMIKPEKISSILTNTKTKVDTRGIRKILGPGVSLFRVNWSTTGGSIYFEFIHWISPESVQVGVLASHPVLCYSSISE